MKETIEEKTILKSSFFFKLFYIPYITWFVISLIALIPDETDPDPITFGELILMNIVLLLIWFSISFIISTIIMGLRRNKSKSKIVKGIPYMTSTEEKAAIKCEEEKQEITENTKKELNGNCLYPYEIIVDSYEHKNNEDYIKEDSKFQGINKYHNPTIIKTAMITLFIITIASLWGSLLTVSFANVINPQHGFNFIKNTWVIWCWLPIPLLSIILGFKYKKAGFKCTKNIIAGFIIGFLLLVYGSFSLLPTFSKKYSNINKYKDFIAATLPNNGELEIQNWQTYFDEDKTEYTIINAYYDKEDVSVLEKSIENSNKWILSIEIKSNLKILLPSVFKSDNDAYYSIYNKTTNEYNTMPSDSGSYEIYAMKYDKSNKQLEIHKFKYLYK